MCSFKYELPHHFLPVQPYLLQNSIDRQQSAIDFALATKSPSAQLKLRGHPSNHPSIQPIIVNIIKAIIIGVQSLWL